MAAAMAAYGSGEVCAANIAPEGTGIFGFNDAVDGDAGMEGIHLGQSTSALNDLSFTTRVDNWKGDSGSDGGMDFSYAGILWDAARTDAVTVLRLTLATFSDGGWFGPDRISPSPGGFLTAAELIAPTVQVTTDAGVTWTTVPATSTYLAAMTGHQIGGGGNINPSSKAITFTLTTPQTNLQGIRIIGENGGVADGGFLGVFELEVEAITTDSDGDKMDDQWELDNGLLVGTNDAAGNPDADGLTNLLEFQNQTDPQNPDTDGDGLNDGQEITLQTDPRVVDTDGDGLNDGAEVSTHLTNPKLADTDADGLSDSVELNVHATNPLIADSDLDGFRDGVEVSQGSNPALASSVPVNIASSGTAIMGTSTAIAGGTDTAYSQQGNPVVINDGSFTTRIDTFGRNDPFSYVGITWATPRPSAVDQVEITFAIFGDGGWFGPNNAGPGLDGALDPAAHLSAPQVQVTTDGTTWNNVEASSNYIPLLTDHRLPAAGAGPTKAAAAFQLAVPQPGLRGIRVIGSEGGIASGGFLGIYEFAVKDVSSAGLTNIAPDGTAIVGVSTAVEDGVESSYTQQGTPEVINDNNYATRTDTFGRSDPFAWAGVVWPAPRVTPVEQVEVTFVTFGDGGWFGPNNVMPTATILSAPETLEEPLLQVTTDGGLTWTNEPNTSTYLAAMTGQVPGGANASPTIVFALTTPRAGINGIRLIGPEGGSASGGFLGFYEFAVREAGPISPTNLSARASAVIGINDAVDGDEGRRLAASGLPRNINDADLTSRVDTFDGAGSDPVSYAGLLWPAGKPVSLESLTLTTAAFGDGGWFGVPGASPAPGGLLQTAAHLVAPTVQVRASNGTWSTAPATSNYLTQLNGQSIGGGANPGAVPLSSVFTFTPAVSGVTGVRLIGDAGGTASGGFIGVFELAAAGSAAPAPADSDGDGQSDASEAIAGTDPANPNSVLRVSGISISGTAVTLQWNSVPGRSYQVQVTENPASGWTNAGAVVPAAAAPASTTSTAITLPAPVAPARLFYRVLVAG